MDTHIEINGYCETSVLSDVSKLIEECRQHSAMGLIIGAPGTGKTTAIDYALEAAGDMAKEGGPVPSYEQIPQCVKVVGSAVTGQSPRLFLDAVFEALHKNRTGYGYASHNLDAVITALRGTGGKSVIVADEAQKLNQASLEVLREIFDATRVGIVMVGNETFRGKFGREDAGQYAHIASRITYRLPRINTVPEGDFRALCAHYGVSDPNVIAALRPIKAGAGGLRHVVAVVEKMFRIVDDSASFTAQLVRDAAKDMGIDE